MGGIVGKIGRQGPCRCASTCRDGVGFALRARQDQMPTLCACEINAVGGRAEKQTATAAAAMPDRATRLAAAGMSRHSTTTMPP